MKLRRPRTLLGLVLVGLGLVTLPLLIAVGNAVLNLGRLADETDVLVAYSDAVAGGTQRLVPALQDIDRLTQQYLIVPRRDVMDFYDGAQRVLEERLAALAALPGNDDIAAQIERIAMTSRVVQKSVHDASASVRPSASAETETGTLPPDTQQAVTALLTTSMPTMMEAARAIGRDLEALSDARLVEVTERTREARRTLAWQAAALVPSTLVLVVLFLLFVGRPLRQVDRAIRELGDGNFAHEIRVSGPADIETLGRQLEWLRNRLKESTEEKNKFLRHMSHELKTPLANIREGTELLLDGSVGALDHQQQEVTGILRDNGVKLQKLIENLLMFSAWQAKTAALELAEFELKPMVFGVLSQHRLTLSNQKIKLDLKVSPIRVRADEGKLKLVIENLLSNAIKFTPHSGTIEIAAGMAGTELKIEIADSGPGVDPADAERIFEAFYQGRRLQGGPVGGTGIGLSVVAECVQAHGGSVRLVQDGRPGARFEVRLPLRRAGDKPQLTVVNG